MTKGSSKRQRQLRVVKMRRQRRQVSLVGLAFRALLDSKMPSQIRATGLVSDADPDS